MKEVDYGNVYKIVIKEFKIIYVNLVLLIPLVIDAYTVWMVFM
jgi:hypothetical protein